MNHILKIAKRELIGIVRDRRALINMILMPMFLIPVLMYLPSFLAKSAIDKVGNQTQKVAMSGVPEKLLVILKKSGLEQVESKNFSDDVMNQVIQGALSCEGKHCVVYGRLASQGDSMVAVEKIKGALGQYKEQLVAEKLKALNVPQSTLEPITFETKDASKKEEKAAGFLAFLIPYMLMIYSLTGAMSIATDSTAGEKEKGTLEALLVAPVTMPRVLAGKVLAVLVGAMISSSSAFIGLVLGGTIFKLFMPKPIGSENGFSLGGQIDVSAGGYFAILVTLVLFAMFLSALLVAIGMYARTFREAQTMMVPITLIMIVPYVMLSMKELLQIGDWIYFVPFANAMFLIDDLIKGSAQWVPMLLTWAMTILAALASLWFAYRNFSREEIIFRN